ncbi:transmembrane protein 88-like [Sinocyclocheilus grahami]|uniref:transmembrane protein 88-like n=1 Tax=Sinocyclocheilus grahami TaxID=75366 RepID=UPI0007AD6510|nr:PREDICTED: transmembrane protein 88-like [Sinocyclocheilus grahami]
MCGMTVLLDDGGGDEDFDVGDGIRMLPPPPAQCDGGVWGARRGHCGCVLWTLLLLLWNVLLLLGCVGLMVLIFSLILLPAALLLYAGFLCHSRVVASQAALCHYLDDNSCSALIILGFVMMSPLVVVAAATFCALLRRLHLLLYFQPIAEARYQGRGLGWRRDIHAWV